MLECEFKSWLGLEFSAYSEARHQGFSLGTPVSSPPSLINGFSQ